MDELDSALASVRRRIEKEEEPLRSFAGSGFVSGMGRAFSIARMLMKFLRHV